MVFPHLSLEVTLSILDEDYLEISIESDDKLFSFESVLIDRSEPLQCYFIKESVPDVLSYWIDRMSGLGYLMRFEYCQKT